MATDSGRKSAEPYSAKIRRAARNLKNLSFEDGVELLVRAGQLSREEADLAIANGPFRAEPTADRPESDGGLPDPSRGAAGPSDALADGPAAGA